LNNATHYYYSQDQVSESIAYVHMNSMLRDAVVGRTRRLLVLALNWACRTLNND